MKTKALPGLLLLLLAVPLATAQPAGGLSKTAAEAGHALVRSANSVSDPADSALRPLCGGQPCDEQSPRLVVTMPPTPPAPWNWQQKAAWAASILLAVLGYACVMIALSLLRKIERQSRATQEAASAAADSARAALLQAQFLFDSARPWLVLAAEPSYQLENGFRILVANHGKSPARIETVFEQMVICQGEEALPPQPLFQNAQQDSQLRSVVLMPGESWPIRSFSRAEVKSVCNSTEQLARVETWQEKIFFYGKLAYRDLSGRRDLPAYESSWCFWYIHGQQKSGMVLAGPAAYHRHS